MNFIPCRLEQAGDGLNVRLSDTIAFAVPAERVPRYRPSAGKELTFGIRPEHVTEAKTNGSKNLATFDAGIEVVEPMGNETMVYFSIGGTEVCGRVDPNAGARVGAPMKLAAHLDHMHLIDNVSGKVVAWERSRFVRSSRITMMSRRSARSTSTSPTRSSSCWSARRAAASRRRLRMIAGLEDITGGEIAIDGEVVNDVPPKDRDMAMVFQNYALYPHMTVYENMSFGLRLKHYPKDEIEKRVQEAARILDIKELLDRKPRQLSGGQRQRVAMGRAIVRNPKVFLFDEPLSNLDAKLRVQMRTEIKRVHQKVRTTTVYVTHDQVEAMTLADRVVVMNRGKIEQIGAPNFLYHSPATRFVAGFIGSPAMNFIPVQARAGGRRAERAALRHDLLRGAGRARAALPSRGRQGTDLRHPARARHRGEDQRLEESRDLRRRHRGGRADGQRDDGVLLDQRHRGVRPHRSECRREGRRVDEDGGASRPHAPDRQRLRQGAVTPCLICREKSPGSPAPAAASARRRRWRWRARAPRSR